MTDSFHRTLDAALAATRPVGTPEMCAAVLYEMTPCSPPESCDRDAVDGSEFCDAHQPYEPDDDPFVYDERDDIAYWGD